MSRHEDVQSTDVAALLYESERVPKYCRPPSSTSMQRTILGLLHGVSITTLLVA